ncbi:histidine phosphatase family protein [Evansella sp. AB-rgal1]|uniref:histidine phosphatase family protein n=1 Tax=Evansella sp. AB-rgal1 TaxID=3242696 RepID=UPI00359D1B94
MGTCNDLDLLLIRHGITEWNVQKRYLGHTDIGLVERELPKLDPLKIELQKQSYNTIFTSDLRRCKQTLNYLSLRTQFNEDARLREMSFGDWEGKTYEDLKNNLEYQRWLNDWEQYSTPNGESWSEFTSRLDSFLDDLIQWVKTDKINTKQKPIVVMTHGGVIRYFLWKFKAVSSFWELNIKEGQAFRLTVSWEGDDWVCNSLLEVPLQEKERL